MTPLIIGAVVLSIALIGGLALGTVLNGDDEPPGPKKPAVPKDFVQLADASGKIRAAVPKAWPRGQEPTWTPTAVSLNDARPGRCCAPPRASRASWATARAPASSSA
jgi:hypothetical protein